jgi:hypothetical protein
MEESFGDAPADVQDQPSADVTTAPSSETSAVEAPEYFSENFDPNTLPPELQSAYKQMHGDYTRKTQTLAEQRKATENAQSFFDALQSEDQRASALQQIAEAFGPDAVLEALGYSTDSDDDVEAESLDPGEQALQAIEELKAQQAAAQAEAKRVQHFAAIDQHVETTLDSYAKDHGLDKVPDELRALAIDLGSAMAIKANQEDGLPQVAEALQKLDAMWEQRQKDWVQSKQAQKVAPGGQPGVEQFDINNPDETIARMAAILDAGS